MNDSAYKIIERAYYDFEEQSMKAQGNTFDCYKLDTLPFVRKSFALLSSEFVLTSSSYSCRLKLAGENPSGMLTFGVPVNPAVSMYWHGRLIEGNTSLLVLPTHSELQAILNPGFSLFSISFSEAVFGHAIESMGYTDLAKRFNELDVLSCDPVQMQQLHRLLKQATLESTRPHWDLKNGRERILNQLIHMLGSFSPRRVPLASSAKKRKAIKDTERYVRAHPDEAPKIKDLCKIIGVSKRTLDYAFNENCGVTPKEYISAIRLNAVHRQLQMNKTGLIRVSDAANDWGFWHMGQFAADYRKLFGELPSETLGGNGSISSSGC